MNYFILLSAGILMLLYALRFTRGWQKSRWAALFVAALSLLVCVYEIHMLSTHTIRNVPARTYLNYIILFAAGAAMIVFSAMLISSKTDKKWQTLSVLYIFSFICINFGIIISVNSYAKGEQILTFLTMELFVVCLLTWRPVIGFLILTVSYLVFFGELDTLVAVNSPDGLPGITESTQINGFTMWLSTLLFCISSYRKTRSQAMQDESLVKMNKHLSEISVTDELTGIHNMFYFREEAKKLLSYVTTDRERVVYLFLDIENFKSYNEQYGFLQGNDLLRRFAKALEKAFPGSIVARYSDDHFVVLTSNEGCEKTVAELSGGIRNNQGEVQLSLKCGAYHPADDEANPSLACDRARFACNAIKKHYDRSFRYYDKSLEDQFQLKQYIVNNIDTAIENGFIKVFYQPVVSTVNGKIVGLEALARWQDPDYGLLPPGAFIGVLEEYRQIYKLDRYIVEQVCRDFRDSADHGEPFAPVSINFSRLDFEMCDMIGHLNEQAEAYGVPRNYLDVEITESALSDRADLLLEVIQSLRSAGYKVWLDDFGSGYSSLNVLKDYYFDVLKVDMKFLSGFGKNKKTTTIIQNIINLTQQLDMVSLTEGVETKEQYEFLRSIGCDRAQGYLFGKPMPLADLRERLHKHEIAVSEEFLNAGETAQS
ncbi:MAG: EAL domain-containing protein [Oscillospiraceae bacterium]|nr:EAL domain-containing protein [Oscillospiraceae bacterium]